MTRHGRQARRAGAFTLIEVMIAVLILALGLLGLGAVFPVVVRSQRVSTDDTLGTGAVNSARALLKGYDFRSAMVPWTLPGVDSRNFWRDWRDDAVNGLNHPNGGPNSLHADDLGYFYVPFTDSTTNTTTLGVPANPGAGRPLSGLVNLPVRERLYPQSPTGDPAPLFVWDIAVHRTPDFNGVTDARSDSMEVVVFVRRLDIRLQSAPGLSVYQAITGERAGGVPNGDRRRPVGVIAGGPDNGLPSNDGTGDYGMPFTADVEFRYNPPGDPQRDRIYMFPAVTANQWLMIRQPGQKLVDNLGQVHTVRTFGESGTDRWVELEAPVLLAAGSRSTLQQVVLTPQVPATVFLVKVYP